MVYKQEQRKLTKGGFLFDKSSQLSINTKSDSIITYSDKKPDTVRRVNK